MAAAFPPPGVRQLNVLGEFKPFGLIADAVDGGTKISEEKYDYFLFDPSVAREQLPPDPTVASTSCDGGDHEIFIRGNRVIWTAGSRVYKRFTSSSPVIMACWCRMDGASEALLCVLQSDSLTTYNASGEVVVIPLPCTIASIWPLPFGLLLQQGAEGEFSANFYSKSSNLLFGASAIASPKREFGQSPRSNSSFLSPSATSMKWLRPCSCHMILRDVIGEPELVYIEERGKLNVMADYDERTIWTSDQVPLMASYNKGKMQHSLWVVEVTNSSLEEAPSNIPDLSSSRLPPKKFSFHRIWQAKGAHSAASKVFLATDDDQAPIVCFLLQGQKKLLSVRLQSLEKSSEILFDIKPELSWSIPVVSAAPLIITRPRVKVGYLPRTDIVVLAPENTIFLYAGKQCLCRFVLPCNLGRCQNVPNAEFTGSTCYDTKVIGVADAVVDRFNVIMNNGQMFRCAIRQGPPSSLLDDCVSAMAEGMCPSYYNYFLALLWGTGDPVHPSRAGSSEWNCFSSILLKIFHRGGATAGESETLYHTSWDFLVNSQFHQNYHMPISLNVISPSGAQNGLGCSMLNLEAEPATDIAFHRELMMDSMDSLHAVYESLKMDDLRKQDLELLAVLLCNMAKFLGEEGYMDHYMRDFPSLLKEVVFHESRSTKPPPSLFRWLEACLQQGYGSADINDLPLLVRTGGSSIVSHARKIVSFFCLLFGGQQDEKDLSSGVCCNVAVGSYSTNEEHTVLAMVGERFGLRQLDCLPPGVSLPLRHALAECREFPPSDWPVAAYILLGREDLAMMSAKVGKPNELDPKSQEADNLFTTSSPYMLHLHPVTVPSNASEIFSSESTKFEDTDSVDGSKRDGMEHIFTSSRQLRYGKDLRLNEVRRLLCSAQPVSIHTPVNPSASDQELQQAQLWQLAQRTTSLPIGRGAFTLGTIYTLLTEGFTVPKLVLSGCLPSQQNATVNLDPNMRNVQELKSWPEFHNAVAAGLRLAPIQGKMSRTWIVYNKPGEPNSLHAGLLLALGLHGFLRVLRITDIYQYLSEMSEAQRKSPTAGHGRVNGYVNGVLPTRNPATMLVVDDFCKALGGKRPIHSILIANNGMAAVKFIRSVRTWAYETFGNEKAILLVAMATPEDMRINAEHIRIADQFVEVPGGTNNNNYANVQLIVEMAEMTRVDAVWPGWGHASENPELPDALTAKGIIFLGPPATSMAALGDKIGSSLIAQAAEVPTLPWSGSLVKVTQESCLDSIPDEIYREACVYTTEEAIASCQVVGYPAMIKASWGGGGKGIRKVHNDDEVRALFKQVQGEVPGSPIFIMKVASQSRHLEVQLLCDQFGNVAALHSRDCSVQRRHQKIIEEGPITVAPPDTVKKLEQAARRLAKCVNYVGAATVEYLYSMETGEYYFLELNPRLQVEHPVTEWIAEVNLPAAQVAVGMGIPLWQIPEIRRFYGKEHGGGYDAWRKTSVVAAPFNFDEAESTQPKGHCVAVRVTSEDPDDGFKPTSGKVQELSFKSKPNVWAYFSVKSGGGIHEFSDSQFGHVFAFGESRALAIANMVLGLKEIQIRGEIRTNVDYTVDLLHAADYRENKIHTGWLDSRIAMRVRAERPPWYLSVVGGALYKASASSAAVVSDYVSYLEKGQIPPKHLSLVHSQVSLNIEGSKYTIDMVRGGPGSYKLKMNESEIEAEIHTLRDGGLLMQLDGNSHVIYAEEEAAGTRLLIDGRTCLLQNDHDPSKLVAETPCKLLRLLVPDGSHVDADAPYAEVEVMKMCMPLLSPASGIIQFKMSEGQAMQAGEFIARLELDDPSAVRKAEPFRGSFPVLGPSTAVSGKVHQRCAASLNAARMILVAGYDHNIDEVMQSLLACLDNPELPFLQWQECLSVLATRLPKDLRNEMETKYKEFERISSSQNVEFPAKMLRSILDAHLSSCPEKEKASLERLIEPLTSLVKSYEGGRESHARIIVQSLFEEYLSVEELFSDNIQADVIERLRLQYKKDLLKVVDIVLSHQGIKSKNKLIMRLMEQLVYPNPAAYRDKLIRFSALNHTSYSELALKASQLLEQTKLSELRSSIARSLSELEMFTEDGESMDTPKRKSAINERMEDLVSAPLAVEDALVGLFDHSDHTLQRRVVETYVRRLYQPYLVKGSVRMQWHRSGLIASWEFLEEHIKRNNGHQNQMVDKSTVEKHSERRWGAMVIIKSLHFLPAIVSAALREASHSLHEGLSNGSAESKCTGNMMHIALAGINNQMSLLQDSGDEDQAQERINKLAKILKERELSSILRTSGVEVISCIIQRDEGRAPMRHSFHWSVEKLYYEEEPLLRHLEPPLSTYLELDKLKGYENMRYSPSRDRQWHLYSVKDKPLPIQRMFLRTLVRQPTTNSGFTGYQGLDTGMSASQLTMSYTSKSIMRSLVVAMEELELNAHNATGRYDHAHMYLYVIQEQQIDDLVPYVKTVEVTSDQEEAVVEAILEELAQEIHASTGVRMHRLGVIEWEVKLWIASPGKANGAWRFMVTNVTGHTCTVHIYRELEDATKQEMVYHSANSAGPVHGIPVNALYKPLGALDRRRLTARTSSTTYCYDFPLAFQTALKQAWITKFPDSKNAKDKVLFKVTELKFADKSGDWGTPLVHTEREPGSNDIGMVAWCMEVSTPEFPSGRTILVVANDVTFKAGSFGPKEDAFFHAVTDLACQKKLPLIYLAANSGARLGVAEEVKTRFRVGWSDEVNPERGFQYVYLTPEDYTEIGSSVIAHELKLASGEARWVIDTIIGKEDGLGVENLTGSGAIAGAYSRAYREIFTLTYVTGRTVGIGAYLARLGMRCIQRLDQPIILTGFSALNKLLGREVYSSHMQLGGPKIMATNGVVHLTVSDDLEWVSAILNWLSYVPPHVGGPLPISNPSDPPERPVEYVAENSCDPRVAIRGTTDSSGKWIGGMFDKDSFVETLEGWARTVVTGRAKLGGIPVGIVAVETQTVMQVIPADPGQLDSHERVVPQAGQVWFPDSATKTAQALLDFNREELPLFILANWRGFSGGQRDLFEGILQAGSTIVENLRTYKQPVFVYIPMMGELRGGAWVVVDSKINPDHIEMYADRTAKGNVLEPEGMIEIKFKMRDLVECMGRLDQQLVILKGKLEESRKAGAFDMVESLQQRIKGREKSLLPVYTQVATKFAELHDTSHRMAAKGVITEVVEWRTSRSFFHKRLRRRVAEASLIRTVEDAAGSTLSRANALKLVKDWFLESDIAKGRGEAWTDDKAFFLWMDNSRNLEEKLHGLRTQKVLHQLMEIGSSQLDLQVLPQSLSALLSKMDLSSRAHLTEELRKVLN